MRYMVGLAALALVAGAVPARAQSAAQALTGAWSGQRADQGGGMDRFTDLYQPNGSFVSVMQFPNGVILRSWGAYRAQWTGQGRMQIDFQVAGYLPQSICTQSPGYGPQCRPLPLPPSASISATMTSDSSFETSGTTVMRDPSPYLLQQRVPQQVMLAGPVPMQQGPMQQGPMQQGTGGYATPNGPGHQLAEHYHEMNQDWIKQHLRGCSKAPDGTYYGCKQ